MNSSIYVGRVRHRRQAPVVHEFAYPLFMMYLDLAELPALFDGRWLWSARRWAPAWFRRADFLGDPAVPLDRAVRDLVEQRTGRRPAGPIRLLANLRYFGCCFNPVSFYYCFDREGDKVETIVAEITNTPWNERHSYVLHGATAEPGGLRRYRFAKNFHVSPFMAMDVDYDWRLGAPGRRLIVHMENRQHGSRIFDASLVMERRALNGWTLAGVLARFPLMCVQVIAAIYWQALRLWLKRCPFFPHPAKARPDKESAT